MEKSELNTASDIMTRRLVTLSVDDVLGNAEEAMRSLRVRHLPVVDADGKLIGLVSHSDVWHAASSLGLGTGPDRDGQALRQIPVTQVMQTELLTIEPNDPLIEVAKLMWDSKVGCLPVVMADGTLVGIVTEADFIALSVELLGSKIQKSDVEELARNRARYGTHRRAV